VLINLGSELLRDFHDILTEVMVAVQDTNKQFRGRPVVVRRAYIAEKHPKHAELCYLLMDGNLEQFYNGLRDAVCAQRVPGFADTKNLSDFMTKGVSCAN